MYILCAIVFDCMLYPDPKSKIGYKKFRHNQKTKKGGIGFFFWNQRLIFFILCYHTRHNWNKHLCWMYDLSVMLSILTRTTYVLLQYQCGLQTRMLLGRHYHLTSIEFWSVLQWTICIGYSSIKFPSNKEKYLDSFCIKYLQIPT